jgi:hypothetical protein
LPCLYFLLKKQCSSVIYKCLCIRLHTKFYIHLLVIAIKLGVEEKVFTITIFLFCIQLRYYPKKRPHPYPPKSIITHIHRDMMVILKVCTLFSFMKKSKLKRKNGRMEHMTKGREDENLLCTYS